MLGATLKNLRMQKGISQGALAEELYVVRQTISKWEKGLSTPSAEQLIHLSVIFDVPIGRLLSINNRHITLELQKETQDSKDNYLSVSRRKEMIAAMTNRLEGMNVDGVEAFFIFFELLPDRERWMACTTPERIAELDDIAARRKQKEAQEKERATREAQQIADANRKQLYLDYARMFRAIESINVPTRYDIRLDEMVAIDSVCGGVRQHFPEYAYSVADKYFKYGFVKGMRYAKAQAKKKQKGM